MPLSVLVISRSQTISTRLECVLRDAHVVHEVQNVGGHLLALGALGNELAEQLPTVIVGDADLFRHDIASSIEALREMSPDSRMLLLADDDRIAELETTLASLDVTVAPNSQSDEELLAWLTNVRDTINSNMHSDTQHDRGDSVDWETTTHTLPNDAQLIREVMNPHGNLHELAVARVLEHCNVPGIGFTTSTPDPAKNTAPVALGAQHFGHLTAPHNPDGDAGTAKLQMWADWLAHWFALQKQTSDLWQMAMRDELTGAWNRRYFNRFLQRIVQHAHEHRTSVTLMIFDIDDFKSYNDKYGHAAGDEILKETARMMQTAVREQDVVARIGGDEFGVIFWDAEAPRRAGSRHPADVRGICERFKKMILAHKFPKLLHEAAGTLTISAGLAGFPWDAKTPDELVERADAMALAGKQEGKNAIKFGPGLLKNGHGHSD